MTKPRKSRGGKVRSGKLQSGNKARSAQSAAPEFDGGGARLLPLGGFAALVFAWVAMLGGTAEGGVNINRVFDFDTVRPWLTFRDAFLTDALPVYGWRLGTAPNYIPDMALSWAIFAAGAGPVAGIWLYTLAQPLLAAGGWILVCDRLFGKSPARRTAVLLAHALCLLMLAWDPPGVFMIWTLSVYHSGTWALIPWVLWLLLIAMGDDASKKRALNVPALGGLFALLCLSVASDLLLLPWFVAPALAVLLCLLALGRMRAGEFGAFAAVLIASVPLGRALHSAIGFEVHRDAGRVWNVKLGALLDIPSGFARWFANLAGDYPLAALVLAPFVVLAAWRGIGALRPSWTPVRIFAEPKSRASLFMALFVPASMAATICAVYINGGGFPDTSDPDSKDVVYTQYHSYILPFVFFPLFVGWALFPWRAELFRVRPVVLALGAVVFVFAAAAPKALAVRFAALNPFNAPFYQCFEEAAGRLNWTGGAASFPLIEMMANERLDVERIIPVGALRRGPGRSRMYLDWVGINRHYFSGEFQFVYVSAFKGRVFKVPPRGEEDRGEPVPDRPESMHAFALTDADVRGAFGDPAEIVECEGAALYHYDPPLRFDFSAAENPDFAQVGRIF